MCDRTRRGFLALGAGLLGATAGCVGADPASAGPTATDRPPGTRTGTESGSAEAVATLAFNHADKLHRVDASFPQRDVATYYLALLTGDGHAASFPTGRFGNAEARAFLRETDFASEAALVLHDRQSSSHPDLELRGVALEGASWPSTAVIPARERRQT
ncbi:hypothetical protein ACFQL4_01410 [Halosimplex aquaticum]